MPKTRIPFGPTLEADVDGFRVAHKLGALPSSIQILRTSAGDVWFQPQLYDAQYVYLIASGSGLSGYLEVE
jgi:hypothetical protein